MGGLLHSATAGTDESGDVVVTVTPADQTQIILHTALRAQFGEAMNRRRAVGCTAAHGACRAARPRCAGLDHPGET